LCKSINYYLGNLIWINGDIVRKYVRFIGK